MSESLPHGVSRWCGWIGFALFTEIWVQLVLMPVLGPSPKGVFGRIFPQQVFIQLFAALILATIASISGRKRWLIVSVAALLSIALFIIGLALD